MLTIAAGGRRRVAQLLARLGIMDGNFVAVDRAGKVQPGRTVLAIPTCVGIGSTKTLAKFANFIAKKTRCSPASAT
jgi:hypothetical protein